MRKLTALNAGLLAGTVLVSGAGGVLLSFAGSDRGPGSDADVVRGIAEVSGPGGVSGTVRFSQPKKRRDDPTPPVKVQADIRGLSPGRHGFHIHENAACDAPSFMTAGGHFDPGPAGHSSPPDHNHPYHAGDLPNLMVHGKGKGHLNAVTTRVTLYVNGRGPTSVFDANGSAVVVHAGPDDSGDNAPGSSSATGESGGSRIACGVIRAKAK